MSKRHSVMPVLLSVSLVAGLNPVAAYAVPAADDAPSAGIGTATLDSTESTGETGLDQSLDTSSELEKSFAAQLEEQQAAADAGDAASAQAAADAAAAQNQQDKLQELYNESI